MKAGIQRLMVGSAGLGALAIATAVQAEPPGVYYSWRVMETTVAQCVDQASQALKSQALTTVQADDNSVAGQSEDATAVFVCLDNPESITVMVIVASADEEQAVALREALKAAF